MKYVAYGCGLLMTLVAFVSLFLGIYTKNMKQETLDSCVSRVAEETLKKVMEEKLSMQEGVEYLLQGIGSELEGKGDVSVEIFGFDTQRGILRFKVLLDFPYFVAGNGCVEAERIVIYEGEGTM